jgi:hypothetical protein
MVRSIELLLDMSPMSQYDAAAMPMYASFGTEADVTLFNVIKPRIDVDVKNKKGDYGSEESRKMDFSDVDRAPMHERMCSRGGWCWDILLVHGHAVAHSRQEINLRRR